MLNMHFIWVTLLLTLVKLRSIKVVLVRQAALEINAVNRFTVNRCKCKGKCNVQQQENESDCGVFAIAFAKCLLEGKDPSEYHFVNSRKHLPEGVIPEFPKVLSEHFPKVLNRFVHIPLKPVTKNITKT